MPANRRPTLLPLGVPTLRCALAAVFAVQVSFALGANSPKPDVLAVNLADLTLEQLSNIEVTSVSKRSERLADAAASVYVISADDIRRSGATTLPEALRLAPNLQVARADANQFAISARGFASVLANKMLVLIDGRTVYSPLFSGVFWEAQSIMLEDVERIEVISGPGATLWGSNAVNGVINILTRGAKDTQGTLVAAGGGNDEKGGAIRHGLVLPNGGSLRLYGKYSEQSHTSDASRAEIRDASRLWQGGFRADWDAEPQSASSVRALTLQGDVYSNVIDQAPSPALRRVSGANVLGRWIHNLGNDATLKMQAYFERTERKQPGSIDEKLDTFDLDVQHGFRPIPDHTLMWGFAYRRQIDRVENLNIPAFALSPASRTLDLASVFLQDEVSIWPNLNLTAGIKFEHNDFTGWEYLPNVRVGWKPTTGQLVWGAVSRTVRAPSRIDREIFLPGIPPSSIVNGGPNFVSEVAAVYELGYRVQPSAALNWSVTAYHHNFDRLRSLEPGPAGPMFDNRIEGTVNGIETWAAYRLTDSWRVRAGFVKQKQLFRVQPGATAIGGTAALGNDPEFWWTLGSAIDFFDNFEFDVSARRVGSLPNPQVPAYTAVDARLGWKFRRDFELSLRASNLSDPRHAEWGVAPGRAEIERSLFVKLLWRM